MNYCMLKDRLIKKLLEIKRLYMRDKGLFQIQERSYDEHKEKVESDKKVNGNQQASGNVFKQGGLDDKLNEGELNKGGGKQIEKSELNGKSLNQDKVNGCIGDNV